MDINFSRFIHWLFFCHRKLVCNIEERASCDRGRSIKYELNIVCYHCDLLLDVNEKMFCNPLITISFRKPPAWLGAFNQKTAAHVQ